MKKEKERLHRVIKERVIKTQGYPNESWIFDFRSVLLNPSYLISLTELLYIHISKYDRIQIGGMESTSIPLITALVLRAQQDRKDVTGFYIRKSRKKTGLHKIIEGELTDAPIVLVDDLINTAQSVNQQVTVLHNMGYSVEMVATIVRFRDQHYYSYLIKNEIPVVSIFTLDEFELHLPEKQHVDQRPYEIHWAFVPKKIHHGLVTARSCPTLYKHVLFTAADDGYFYALDKNTGASIWKIGLGLRGPDKVVLSTPAVANEIVYFGSYDGKVYALDVNSGVVRWIFSECDWVGSSPALDAGRGILFIGLEHGHPTQKGSIVALDMQTGEKVWEYKQPALTHASPLVIPEHNIVCIGGNAGVLHMLKIGSGELIWQFETKGGQQYPGVGGFSPGDIKMAPVYDAETDQIAFSSMDGHVYSVDRKTGSLRYHVFTEQYDTTAHIGVYSSPIFTGEHIIFGSLDKNIYCCDKKTGEEKWKVKTGGRIFTAPVVRDSIVYAGSNDGVMYEIEENTGTVLARRQFSERIVCPVVFDGGVRMYVTTHGGVVHAVSFPQ